MLVAFIIGATILIGILGYQFLFSSSHTSIKAATRLSSVTYVESASGLRLYLTLDPTVINSGRNIIIKVYENNTLDTLNNVSVADHWATERHSFPGCSFAYLPVGIAVFRGNHSADDLVQSVAADQLQVDQPGVAYSCGAVPDFHDYGFRPLSDSAELCGAIGRWNNGTAR